MAKEKQLANLKHKADKADMIVERQVQTLM